MTMLYIDAFDELETYSNCQLFFFFVMDGHFQEVAMLEIPGYNEAGDSIDQHWDMRLDVDHMSYEVTEEVISI